MHLKVLFFKEISNCQNCRALDEKKQNQNLLYQRSERSNPSHSAQVAPNNGKVVFKKSLIIDWLHFIDSLTFIYLPNIVELFL